MTLDTRPKNISLFTVTCITNMAAVEDEEFAFTGNVIFALIIIGLNVLVLVPLMCYFGFTFWRRSKDRSREDNEVFFDRRHPSTIYATIAFSIFFCGIERPTSILIYQLGIIELPSVIWEYSSSDSPFQFFSYALGAFGIYFTFLQRELMVGPLSSMRHHLYSISSQYVH